MRVVVTGYGLITAAGANANESWKSFTAGRTGIGAHSIVPTAGVTSDRAGQVTAEPEPEWHSTDRAIRLGARAITEALQRAQLSDATPYPPERCGLSLGTSLGGARSGERFHRDWVERGLLATRRLDLIEYPLHATADSLAQRFRLHGPRTVHSNACAAGSVAIMNGYEYLVDGQADMVVGGVDPLAWLSFGGFSSLGVLSQLNCAPYTRSDGITLGEGAGILILEPYDLAVARGAQLYAELLGYGLSADGYHATAPDPRNRGALAAIASAVRLSGITAEQIDYVNGHGTGTPANDTGELKTLRGLGDGNLPMSSTKSMTGHTLGAAGAIEAVVSVLTLERGMIHPTYVPPDSAAQEAAAGLATAGVADIVRTKRPFTGSYVLSNSFAFGGNNASLIFGRPDRDRSGEHAQRDTGEAPQSASSVVVSAMAVGVGAATQSDALRAALQRDCSLLNSRIEPAPGSGFRVGSAGNEGMDSGVNPRVLRRLDHLGRLAAQGVHELLSRLELSAHALEHTGIVFATSTGPLSTVEVFQRELIVDGHGESKLFPNTVMNAAAGQIAVLFGVRGPTATFCAGGVSGVSAVHFAHQLIRNRSCERVIVVAADEVNTALIAGYSRFPGYLAAERAKPHHNTGISFSEGAVAWLLENEDVAVPLPEAFRVTGMGLTGSGPGPGRLGSDAAAWHRSFEIAIQRAGITVTDLDLIVTAACGHEPIDAREREALELLEVPAEVPRISPKAVTGEAQSVSALAAAQVAVWLLRGDTFTVDGETVRVAATPDRVVRYALVSAYSVGGSFQSYVVRYATEAT